jgi:hypothetical protein
MATILSSYTDPEGNVYTTSVDGDVIEAKQTGTVDPDVVNGVKPTQAVRVTSDAIVVAGNDDNGNVYERAVMLFNQNGYTEEDLFYITTPEDGLGSKVSVYDTTGYWEKPHAIREGSRIYLGGLLRITSGQQLNAGDTILTIPAGYRPRGTIAQTVVTQNGLTRVSVRSDDGRVTFDTINGGVTAATGYIFLDGISYLGEELNYSLTVPDNSPA